MTLLSYALVTGQRVTALGAVAVIITLALVQLIVQMVFFLHIGQEERPRWKLWAFISMFAVLMIVVVGSLWIMNNLNYNMGHDMDARMMKERDKGF